MRRLAKTDANFESDAKIQGLNVIRRVAPYLWPVGDTRTKIRVVAAISVLLLANAIAVGTPFFYAAAVDALATDAPDTTWLIAFGAVALTMIYGLSRLATTGLTQLRDVIFTPVGQHALSHHPQNGRTVAYN
jgi:ABC-type multidrug transport system fused ATPase/permease subunit